MGESFCIGFTPEADGESRRFDPDPDLGLWAQLYAEARSLCEECRRRQARRHPEGSFQFTLGDRWLVECRAPERWRETKECGRKTHLLIYRIIDRKAAMAA